MKKNSEKQDALIADLHKEMARLTSSVYALLDDVMNVRLDQKDNYSDRVKSASTDLIEKAMNTKED